MWSSKKGRKEREKVFFMIERVDLLEDDFEYEIFSMLSITRACASVIFAGKRDHSTKGFSENAEVVGASCQM